MGINEYFLKRGSYTKGERLYALDIWRSGFLLMGVLLHTAYVFNIEHPSWGLRYIQFLSSTFRMEGFFAIAGFLAAKSIKKQRAEYIARRTRQLAIPFVTAAMLCVPVAHFFMTVVDLPLEPSSGIDHLWFLVTLMLVTSSAYYMYISGATLRIFNTFKHWHICVIFLGFIVASGIVNGATLKLINLLIVNRITGDYFTFVPIGIRSIYFFMFYITAFVFGLYSGKVEKLSATLIIIGLLSIASVTYLYWSFEELFYGNERSVIIKFVTSFISPLIGSAVILSAFVSSKYITNLPKLLKRLSSSSYTIYIIHYPVVFMSYAITSKIELPLPIRFVIVIGISLLAPYAFHHFIVDRTRWAGFLFNGKDAFSEDRVSA